MHSVKTPIYQTQQIREFERLAEERFSLSSQSLMLRAGKAACDFLFKRWPQAKKITFFCGSGNNGGDGYILAELAYQRGIQVTIWQVGSLENMKSEAAKAALKLCREAELPMYPFNEMADLNHPDLIIDAICGTGLHDPVSDEVAAAIKKMHRSHAPIFAIDVPTGINADTGQSLGVAVQATATITFIGLKLGLLTGGGISYVGELIVNDLQLPDELFELIPPIAEKLTLSSYMHYLKPRLRDWHKGLSGSVLVIGGNLGLSGAPRMAAEAALRVGAGLVTVATHKDNAAVMNASRPEIMCHGISKAADLKPLLERADVVVLGPGLGQETWSSRIWESISLTELPMPIVVDGDGLNFLSKSGLHHENWVLTPHPGEAARLLAVTSETIQGDRLNALKNIANRYGGVCVLKGAGTLISAPNILPAVCNKGNPGMATAGMGDVLSGVIGGLLAQGIPLGDAAKLGVGLHAMAGDLAAKEGERGLLALDLMPHLHRLVNNHL